MSDIFISYSSKDREKAEQLTELLASAGLSVWIDQSGIDVATSWSKEIVDAIDECKAFVVMLSPNSIASVNVIKEVSLAAEQKKKILPLDIEPVELPSELRYHLAGIQRSSMTNIDAIIRALGKLGLEATHPPTLKLVKEADTRKSLMILPFEDLSPTADNQWFADGIVSELINVLSNVKALRLIDAQTTKEFKNYRGHLAIYAKEMRVRYFVQGDVRKFGDQIKISTRLLDIETGDHLWRDSLKGTMDDIFDIQETVAKKVVDALHIILTTEEEKNVKKKLTENTDAYELYLKGKEYYRRTNSPDFLRAITLMEEAVTLDPHFTEAHIGLANTFLAIYRLFSRESKWIDSAREHITTAESIVGTTKEILWVRSVLSLNLGQYEESLLLCQQAIELDSAYALAYDSMGFAFQALGKPEEAATARKCEVLLQENNRTAHFNYLIVLNELGDQSRLAEAARQAIPLYERHLRLAPDDLQSRVQYANTLRYAGEGVLALAEARKLEQLEGLDAIALYNLACIFLDRSENASALSALRKSIDSGYRNIETLHRDPDLAPLRGTTEFEDIIQELEKKSTEKNNV